MSFFFYDVGFLIIFSIMLIIFLIKNRKNIKREGVLILYRTGVGLKLIDYFSKKYKRLINYSEYAFIFLGYCLMISVVYLLFRISYLFFRFPEFIKIIKIPPVVPLIPYLPEIFNADYLPSFYFTYWIVVLALTAIFHEFSHGIFARARGVKIKSTGFAFLGPFTAFFVEPDEKKVEKLKIKNQLSFIAAGSIANLILTFLFFLLLWGFFISAFVPAGIIFNTYPFTSINSSDISGIGNETISFQLTGKNLTSVLTRNGTYYVDNISNLKKSGQVLAYEDTPALKAGLKGIIFEVDNKKINSYDNFKEILEAKKPDDIIIIKTLFNNSIKEYRIKLASKQDNKSAAYLGIALLKTESSGILSAIRNKVVFFKNPNIYYKPKLASDLIFFIYNLIWWLVFINFSVALGNMLPVGIADGGRFFYLTILGLTKNKKIAQKLFSLSTKIILLVFAFLMLLWFFGFFR